MPKLALFALALLSACQLPAPQPEPWDHMKLEGYSANGIDITLPQRRYVFDARGGSQSIAGGRCPNLKLAGERSRGLPQEFFSLPRLGSEVEATAIQAGKTMLGEAVSAGVLH